MTYEYECVNDECSCAGKTVCIDHSMAESPEIKCKECGQVLVRKILGGAGFIMSLGGTRSGT